MNDAVPNQRLFRLYAAAWVLAASAAVAITFQLVRPSPTAVFIYLGIAAVMWGVDARLAGGRRPHGHGVSHGLLIAAIALVWPLAIVVLAALLAGDVAKGLRR
ncbi:hypothetical protein ABZ725_14430 [Streptomyces sp. NPDC006872]|uniref:hypothetical protein n=1 Tax=Streptomyces sp. NPDC006872 TaxID=3155720 RepID=UPI0033D76ACA